MILLHHVAERDPAFHLFLHLAAYTGARRAQLLAPLDRDGRLYEEAIPPDQPVADPSTEATITDPSVLAARTWLEGTTGCAAN